MFNSSSVCVLHCIAYYPARLHRRGITEEKKKAEAHMKLHGKGPRCRLEECRCWHPFFNCMVIPLCSKLFVLNLFGFRTMPTLSHVNFESSEFWLNAILQIDPCFYRLRSITD